MPHTFYSKTIFYIINASYKFQKNGKFWIKIHSLQKVKENYTFYCCEHFVNFAFLIDELQNMLIDGVWLSQIECSKMKEFLL